MRIDNIEFDELNKSSTLEPVIVVALSFDETNTDIHYLTSRPVADLSGNIINDTLKVVSSTSQKINPEKALSTIGNISFECLDFGITELQRDKLLNESKGLKNKRARVHFGYVGLPWDKFVIVNTQIISNSISYKDGVFKFSCSDVQRLARKKLFVLKETYLTASITSSDTSIPASNTSQFSLVYNPPFNEALAPGQEIGLLKIEQDGVFEIIKWTSKNSTNFLGCERGIFGTPKLDIEVSPGSRGPVIEEFVYLCAPAIMVAYALYTGSWYGHPGKFLPDHWNLGVSTDYIKTSDFISFPDLWDVNNINVGVPATVIGESDVDGKQFIETQIYYMLSLYSPVNTMGELGLKRLTPIISSVDAERVLDIDNIVRYGDLDYDTDEVVNLYILKWDYSIKTDSYKRASTLIDFDSIDKHTASDTKVIELRTLFGSNDSQRVINHNFENLRSRTSSPPFKLSLTLTPDQNDLEVGDLVTVNLEHLVDFNVEGTGFRRLMEVQSIKIDWMTGNVNVELFGSSSLPGSLIPPDTETIDRAWLSTNVPSENYLTPSNPAFSGAITSSDGITRITSPIHLSGQNYLNGSSCFYYCPEELQIDPGVEVTHDLNVQIRVNGYFTVNGDLNGKGRGYSGGTDSRTLEQEYDSSSDYKYSLRSPNSNGPGSGLQGIGSTRSQGSLLYHERMDANVITTNQLQDNNPNWLYTNSVLSLTYVYAKHYDMTYQLNRNLILIKDGALTGLPDSLIGSSGSCGGAVWVETSPPGPLLKARGGNGGASGAGLVIISAGLAIGANGSIDVSGDDGALGETYQIGSNTYCAGSGAGGHCGGLIIMTLDSTQYTEPLNSPKIIQRNGVSPTPSGTKYKNTYGNGYPYMVVGSGNTYYSNVKGTDEVLTDQNEIFSYLEYLDATASYEPIGDEYVESEPTFTLTKYENTPVTPNGELTTIEVSVTPPADSNYSYSLVEYRKQGDAAWTPAPPASHEAVFPVISNGITYDVRIRPVSKQGTATPSGPVQTITVTNVFGRTDAILSGIYPFSALNLSVDNVDGAKFKYGTARLSWDHDNSELNYFNHYEIEVSHATDGIIRTEIAAASNYEYSLAKNQEDYFANNATEGIYDEVTFSVRVVSKIKNDLNVLYKGAAETVTVDRVPPPDVPEIYFSEGFLIWTYANTPADFSGFELRTSTDPASTWETAEPMFNGLVTFTKYYLGSTPSNGTRFFVKAKDLSRNESVNPALIEIQTPPSPIRLNSSGTMTVGASESVRVYGYAKPSDFGGYPSSDKGSISYSSNSNPEAKLIYFEQRFYYTDNPPDWSDGDFRFYWIVIPAWGLNIDSDTITGATLDGINLGTPLYSYNSAIAQAIWEFKTPATNPPPQLTPGSTVNFTITST